MTGQTDRRTDGQTLDRFIERAVRVRYVVSDHVDVTCVHAIRADIAGGSVDVTGKRPSCYRGHFVLRQFCRGGGILTGSQRRIDQSVSQSINVVSTQG